MSDNAGATSANPLVAFRYSEQFKGWMITGKVSALLSIIGSALIVHDILKSRKQHWMTNRIMIGLSASDLLWSLISPFVGTWLVPSGLAFGSSGNRASCTAQGFLTQTFGFWSGLYNAALAVCYLLVVRWQVRNEQLLKIEWAVHAVLLVVGIATAVPPLAYGAYNYNGWWLCHTAASPLGCDAPGSGIECDRGSNALLLHRWLWNIPHGCLFVIVLLAMAALYVTVLQQERAGDKYRYDGRMNRQLSKKVATKGILYVGAFFVTWSSYYVIFFIEIAGGVPPTWLFSVVAFFVPLQGFFNAFVYFHKRIFRKVRGGASRMTVTVGSRVSYFGASIYERRSARGSMAEASSFDNRSGHDTNHGDVESGPDKGAEATDGGELGATETRGSEESPADGDDVDASGNDGPRAKPTRPRQTLVMAAY